MKKIATIILVIAVLLCGCKTENPTDNGDKPQPIVSPTNISDTAQDGDAPTFPYFIPWWAK